MPEKNPDIWKIIWLYLCEYIANNRLMISGVLVAGLIAFLKAMSDKKKDTFWSVTAEVITCMLITGSAFELLAELQITESWYKALAVGIGYYGTAIVRQLSDRLLSKLGVDTGKTE